MDREHYTGTDIDRGFLGQLAVMGITTTMLEGLLNHQESMMILAHQIQVELKVAHRLKFNPVNVDYGLRPEEDLSPYFEPISDGYQYAKDWRRHELCESVPTKGQKSVKCSLLFFGRSLQADELKESFIQERCRPATFEEAIAFARKHPNLQRLFPIAAFGTSCFWKGYQRVPYLFREAGFSFLRLHMEAPSEGMFEDCRYLVVPL